MLTPEQVEAMLAQANEQSTQNVAPTVTPTVTETKVIKEGDIIEPKVPEYKTEEQLREEALKLALDTEKETEILTLQAQLDDDAVSAEDKEAIRLKLKELNPEIVDEILKTEETPEQELARLKKELEELKQSKEETKNPLEAVELQAKEKGIEISKLYEEYVTSGELSEESYKSLIDAGFNEVAIQAYIDTRTIIEQTKAINTMKTVTGSVENYQSMLEWMNSNLTQAEIDAYAKGVNTEHVNIYVENMYSKYTKATKEPVVIRNNGYVSTGNKPVGFKSLNEQNLAMADARYGTDAKYTAEVRNKVLSSTY